LTSINLQISTQKNNVNKDPVACATIT